MTPSVWPDWLDDVWAKSAGKGEGGAPETLAQHTWNVLSRLADFIQLRPHLPSELGAPRLWEILFWSAFLHDWGKAASGFQERLRGGKKWPHRHEVLSLAFVEWFSGMFSKEELCWLVAAIVSHHKDAEEIRSLYPLRDDWEDEDQIEELLLELDGRTIKDLWRWLDECAAAWIDDLGFVDLAITPPSLPDCQQAVAIASKHGATCIRYWLKVYRRLIKQVDKSSIGSPVVLGTLALRGHIINADHSASAHAGALPGVSFDAEAVLSSRKISRNSLYRHQILAEKTQGSAILSAPTGSGKTEAALLWAAGQSNDQHAPRLFYALPYQASMNAMKQRLEMSFGPGQVGLQHGRVLLALYRMLLEQDNDPQEASAQAKRMRNLVQLNYPPVRVFSPYQMLKGMYRLKGYEAMLTDYHDALFIFDEIHAYEVKRLAMILKTIQYLAENYRARFLVMSATFPTLIKEWLLESLGESTEIQAEPALFDAFKRHRLVMHHGGLLSDDGLERISADARSGKSVLVVCNLVERAQMVYELLDEALDGVHVELLHGRFNGRDRLIKEKIVQTRAGAQSQTADPLILVSTQVVEVSLDIDFDTIYTEPAPLEALVQRFGRVNRLRKKGFAAVNVFRLPDDGQHIYDETLVNSTLAILERENGNVLDESSIGSWLDEIYSGNVAKAWKEKFEYSAREFDAVCTQTLRAFQADEMLEELFYQAFDGLEVIPESSHTEYQQLKEEDPIRANELLVPISWGRYFALANEGRVYPKERREPYVVKVKYSPEKGLDFNAELDDDYDE
ncbi:MAG: CRISPR-associated helicase Cas3' [Anaerolineales bacterium]|nr:CRISPR-associated helicase Cas3' [Anaerolineales bacterium]